MLVLTPTSPVTSRNHKTFCVLFSSSKLLIANDFCIRLFSLHCFSSLIQAASITSRLITETHFLCTKTVFSASSMLPFSITKTETPKAEIVVLLANLFLNLKIQSLQSSLFHNTERHCFSSSFSLS
ncbi:hypothetical protein YC2023_025999 [Brassica napus]